MNKANPIDFARKAHAGQFRAGPGNVPYIEHPLRVASLVANLYEGDSLLDAVAAALLHDVIEDCDVTKQQLAEVFSPAVCQLVAQLTKPDFLSKASRVDWMLETAPGMLPDAADVKCADRADNLLSMIGFYEGEQIAWSTERKRRYVAEAERLHEGLVTARPQLRGLLRFTIDEAKRRL